MSHLKVVGWRIPCQRSPPCWYRLKMLIYKVRLFPCPLSNFLYKNKCINKDTWTISSITLISILNPHWTVYVLPIIRPMQHCVSLTQVTGELDKWSQPLSTPSELFTWSGIRPECEINGNSFHWWGWGWDWRWETESRPQACQGVTEEPCSGARL